MIKLTGRLTCVAIALFFGHVLASWNPKVRTVITTLDGGDPFSVRPDSTHALEVN